MEGSDILQPGVSIKPKVNFNDVKNLVLDLFGLKVDQIFELNGYDDKNYHVIVNSTYKENEHIHKICEDGYVLKIINSLDSKNSDFFEAQNAALLHLRKNGIECPKPIFTKDGSHFSKVKLPSGEHVIRLLEFIKGIIFHQIKCTPDLLFRAGQFVAKIDDALKNFSHPAYEKQKSLWKLESIPQLPQFLFAVSQEERRKLVLNVIDEFNKRVLRASETFEKGMIHGDFNEQNIIMEKENDCWKIKAIIDFGDTHRACYLFELAITMTYMILQAKDINAGGYVLAGYSLVKNLPENEKRLLKVCIAARLCQSLVLGAYSNLQDPENSYLLLTAAQGWIMLEKLWEQSEDELLEKWRAVCEGLSNTSI